MMTEAPGVAEAFAREERAGLTYIFWARMISAGLLAVWALTLPIERSGTYLLILALFALLGLVPYMMAQRRARGAGPVVALFLLLDAIFLSYVLIVPAQYAVAGWTPQLNLRLWNFLYLGLFLVGMALSYSPALVVWAGFVSAAAWSAGVFWVANLPESNARTASEVLGREMNTHDTIREFLSEHTVSLTALQYQIAFLVLATVILTLTVWRSRQLVHRQVAAETQRMALSRYFSPNIVRELSTGRGTLDSPAVQPVAVLFADMAGFTAISERLSPQALVTLLREFHGRLAGIAFAHDGTVDKYIGDAIMVHFGTPQSCEDDPVRALACAAEMIASIGRWNAERRARGEVPVQIGAGLHYGEAVVGNIGDERRLEYTVLGDTVNLACRLEELTRELGTTLVASDDLVRAVRQCGADPLTLVPGLRMHNPRTVRGRSMPVTFWSDGQS
ncbi:MAG: adenylate/guanylate cyclase domain-containing protein [Geminicoccaceae bacterium]